LITLPCNACGTPIPYPLTEEKMLQCPQCGELRKLWSFSGRGAYERWHVWSIFNRGKATA
jgi:uncharacterized C2H2 Zn-finger protein